MLIQLPGSDYNNAIRGVFYTHKNCTQMCNYSEGKICMMLKFSDMKNDIGHRIGDQGIHSFRLPLFE